MLLPNDNHYDNSNVMDYEYDIDLVHTLLLKNNIMEKMESMTGHKIIGRGNDRPILSPAGSLLGVLEITPTPSFKIPKWLPSLRWPVATSHVDCLQLPTHNRLAL